MDITTVMMGAARQKWQKTRMAKGKPPRITDQKIQPHRQNEDSKTLIGRSYIFVLLTAIRYKFVVSFPPLPCPVWIISQCN